MLNLDHAAHAQRRATIPEAVAGGAVGAVSGGTPSGPPPTVASLLAITDVLVSGRVGEPHSHLSDDQTEVHTDYDLEDAVVLFERHPRRSPTPSATPQITVTQLGGAVNVLGIIFTQTEHGLPPLKPGTQVLCLLTQQGNEYRIAYWYWGVFAVDAGRIKVLTSRDDFAPDYRDVPFQQAVQSMLTILLQK